MLVKFMEIFSSLDAARAAGMYLGRFGQYPTIYKRGSKYYIVIEKGEWPPLNSWPFLKWDGRDWVRSWMNLGVRHSSKGLLPHSGGWRGQQPSLCDLPL